MKKCDEKEKRETKGEKYYSKESEIKKRCIKKWWNDEWKKKIWQEIWEKLMIK